MPEAGAGFFDVPAVITVANGDVPGLLAWVEAHPTTSGQSAFLQFNHPRHGSGEAKDYGRDDYPTERQWVDAVGAYASLIEVLNAPALKDGVGFRTAAHQTEYLSYLNMGFHLGPSVGQDNHYRHWGTSTDARVGVVADSLSKTDVLNALRARRTFASEDKNLRIIFRANGAIGGDITAPPAPDSELDLSVDLRDPDEPHATYRIDVFLDEPGGVASKAPVETLKVVGDGLAHLDGVNFTRPGAYVLLRITQYGAMDDADHEREDDRAWTAPVWFEFADLPAPPAAGTPAIHIVSLTPNPLSNDTLNEEIVLRNDNALPVLLDGWIVRDLAQTTWRLDGVTADANATVTIKRAGQRMSMNNAGDTIDLVSPGGSVVQTVTYGPAAPGQVVMPPR